MEAGAVAQWALAWHVLDPGFNLQNQELRMEGMSKGGEEWGREGKERQRDREEIDKEMERF